MERAVGNNVFVFERRALDAELHGLGLDEVLELNLLLV